MLFIDAEELRKKGNIVLLGGGAILEGITNELLKVLDNIEDVTTDPEKNRKIKIEFAIKPNYNRDKVSISCDVSSTLAPKNVLSMKMNLEKAIEDEGRLITLREDLENAAEGQLTIDGDVVEAESLEIHQNEKETIVDADFVEINHEENKPVNENSEQDDFLTQDEPLTEDFGDFDSFDPSYDSFF